MTEKLRTLLDRATDVEFATPDPETIMRTGDRAVRRRGVAVGAAGLAAAAVTTTGVVLVAGAGAGPESRVADASPRDAAGMSWAVGSVLHTPTSTTEVGHPVRAYVRTSSGYVTVDDDGRVWSVVGEEVAAVGRTTPSSLGLVGDTEDSLAAWLEPGDGNAWRWVVLDQATGERVLTVPAGRGPDVPGNVVAVDARRLYVSAGGYRAIGVDDGTETAVDPPVPAAQLLSVEDGVLAWADPGDDDGASEYLVGRPEAEPVRITSVHGHLASFSPDARWVSFDADEPRVHDVATGDQVDIELDGRVFGTGYEWLDDDSLAVIASRHEVGPVELLVCDVPSGACGVVAPDLGSFDEALAAGIALPGGSVIDE